MYEESFLTLNYISKLNMSRKDGSLIKKCHGNIINLDILSKCSSNEDECVY